MVEVSFYILVSWTADVCMKHERKNWNVSRIIQTFIIHSLFPVNQYQDIQPSSALFSRFFSRFVPDCYRREKVGVKHHFSVVRESLIVESVQQCSIECSRVSFCSSFSFRYFLEILTDFFCFVVSI